MQTKINLRLFLAILIGIISGYLTLYFFTYVEHLDKFLNWPFLGFFLILILALIFYDHLLKIFNRGEIKVKWGDREISFNDIPEKVEQEVSNQLESQRQNEEDKIDIVKNDIIKEIKKEFSIGNNNLASLIFQLGDSNLIWRSLFTLAKRTGLEPQEVERICRENPEILRRGIGKSGKVIFKLQDSAKQIYEQKIKY